MVQEFLDQNRRPIVESPTPGGVQDFLDQPAPGGVQEILNSSEPDLNTLAGRVRADDLATQGGSLPFNERQARDPAGPVLQQLDKFVGQPLDAFTEDTFRNLSFRGPVPDVEGLNPIEAGAESFRRKPFAAQLGLSLLSPEGFIAGKALTPAKFGFEAPKFVGRSGRTLAEPGPVIRQLSPDQLPPSVGGKPVTPPANADIADSARINVDPSASRPGPLEFPGGVRPAEDLISDPNLLFDIRNTELNPRRTPKWKIFIKGSDHQVLLVSTGAANEYKTLAKAQIAARHLATKQENQEAARFLGLRPPGGTSGEVPGQAGRAGIADSVAEQAQPTVVPPAKTQHIESAAPDGPSQPPIDGGQPIGSSGVPPIENRLLTLAGPGKQQNERLDQSILRFHEASIDNAKREAGDIVTRGNRQLSQQKIGIRSGTSLAARPEDIPKLDGLHEALHNPSKVASGEVAVPTELRGMYDELRQLMDWETAARLDFDPEMATVADYFYRGWKPPAGMFPPTGRGSLVTTPAFKKPRNGATYQEMRDLGFEPLFWNPYEQWRTARLQGVRFREQMELVEALKSLGDDMIRPHEGGPIKPGWRVPEIGPAFEGKPFATTDKLTDEPRAMFTRRWIVRDEMANPLESMYGKRPTLGNVRVGGKNVDILKAIDWAVFLPKRAKLFGSFFQQIDFTNRAGIGSWHGMVNALRTGHPIEAVQHLALYPKTAAEMLRANFQPNFRSSLKDQLRDTKPLIQDRPGVTLKGISDSGLSIQDVTILPQDLDSVVREVAQESGLIGRGKAIPRAIGALEGAMRRGLFEGVYPAAIINDVKNNIAPVIARTYPNLTDAQMNSAIATLANKRFSTIPASQSVIQNRVVRETLRRVMFSVNESEGLLRQATGTIKGPSKAFWIENWLGAFLFLMATAETIHFASTGEFLPLDRFTPISEDTYGPLPIGYNRNFASPDLPLVRGKGDIKLTLDIVGQMDTAFRVLDPGAFIQSRESVPIRAFQNQLAAENFYGEPIDEVGPGGVASRTVQLAQDLFSPIGFGQAGAELLREELPEGLIAGTEERIGLAGQLIQASGVNVRGEIIDDTLKRENPGWENWSDSTYDSERAKLLERIFGARTEKEKERFEKETREFFGTDKKEARRDKFFGR